ncbi:hybrid sensor histidine kinase/response regulator [Indioceanicola profundi]|uniref:hybrid sensor histidine kinase/response regulator n=1 Tax=Indioceanicola profundi TaxID=2220096 RepID=UPI000E6AB33D|nr:hybrid sensor histidine kinase/response regulator [Indioceanicola profundi]
MNPWLVLLVAGGYIAVLFAVAWQGERRGRAPSAFSYVLTLAVYNTVWSFYGSVGRAASSGWDFAQIYVGPTLLLLFAQPVLARVIAVAKARNVTSIADFLSARYGNSQTVAVLVTLAGLVSLLPYIALQLKGISASFDMLTSGGPVPAAAGAGAARGAANTDTALAVTVAMAVFAILFGVRHLHASEHHRGLMRAIAFESLVKLAAFAAVGGYIVYGLNDGLAELYARGANSLETSTLVTPDFGDPSWIATTLISILAFLCLPHLFHVAVVENQDPAHMRRAAWLYPGYLLVLSVLMIPVALAGIAAFGRAGADPDSYMITIPLTAGADGIALLAFIGGFSAGTGMVIMAAVSLSTMLCNDVILPTLLRLGALDPIADRTGAVLNIRRLAVVFTLGLAYATYLLLRDGYPLTTIGLMSFVAVAQFGPAFLGGLYWRRATRRGAIASLSAGLLLWVYTLLLPAVQPGAVWVLEGPFGLGWLRPGGLFGVHELDPISHATLFSLLTNVVVFVGISLATRQSAAEREHAVSFVEAMPGQPAPPPPSWRGLTRVEDLRTLAAQYMGPERARRTIDAYLAVRSGIGVTSGLDRTGWADADLARFVENQLAGVIGAASARVVLATAFQGPALTRGAAVGLLDEASSAIRANYELLRSTLESVNQGICVLDRDLKLVTWNQRYLDLLDLPPERVRVGVPLAHIIRFNAERGEYAAGDLDVLLVSRDLDHTKWPYVFKRSRPDGTVIEATNTLLPGGGFVATYTDVTEREKAAAALQEANESLERRVRERTLDLEDAKAEAERANAVKTRFLAGVSHDLMQPLSAARLFSAALTEQLQQAAGNPVTAEHLALARNSAASIRSVETLIGALLDISALEAGAVRPELRNFPISMVMERLGIEFQALAAEAGVRLKVIPCRAHVRSDPALLRRILQNFLSNAIRYTGQACAPGRGRVVMGCRYRRGALRIEVWDTGPGIDPALRTEIFQEFQRSGRRADRSGGLGLGLAIVDRTARMLDHPVELVSEPGRGSCFAVSVPTVKDTSMLAAEAPATPGPALDGLTVLCVDDDGDVLSGLVALLKGWGCRPVRADNAATAAAALGGVVPDAVLLDFHLGPERNGLDVLRELAPLWPAPVPAAILTADRTAAVRDMVRAADLPLLQKPVRPAALRRLLGGIVLRRSPSTAAPPLSQHRASEASDVQHS